MNSFVRTVAATVVGFGVGMAIGPVSLLMADVSDVLIRGWSWPERRPEYALTLLLSSIPAGVNGGLGAALAATRGIRGRREISVLPVLFHIGAAVFALAMDARYLLFSQMLALMFSVVVWPAGRLGQMIGGALGPKRKPLPHIATEHRDNSAAAS